MITIIYKQSNNELFFNLVKQDSQLKNNFEKSQIERDYFNREVQFIKVGDFSTQLYCENQEGWKTDFDIKCLVHGHLNNPFKSFESKELELILYGGSFNPIHEGHRECLRLMSKSLTSNERIVVIPDSNPLKKRKVKNSFKEFKALSDDFQETVKCSVFSGFYGHGQGNPTSTWVPQIKNKSSILIGDDSFINIESWINFDILIKGLSKIYVVSRNLCEVELNKLKIKFEMKYNKPVVLFLSNKFNDLSSREIRND